MLLTFKARSTLLHMGVAVNKTTRVITSHPHHSLFTVKILLNVLKYNKNTTLTRSSLQIHEEVLKDLFQTIFFYTCINTSAPKVFFFFIFLFSLSPANY